MNTTFDIIHSEWNSFKDDNIEYDLIYLDPPFFTQTSYTMSDGKSSIGFEDRWKNLDEYMEWFLDVFETSYNSLSSSGVIYSHNNFKMNSFLLSALPKKISNNFVTNISWLRSHPHNNIKKSWGNIVDSIMMISKTKDFYFKVLYGNLDNKYSKNSFTNKDSVGNYSLTPITGEKSRIGYDFEYNNVRPKFGWRYKEDKIKKLHDENLIHWGKNKPYKKLYLHESKGRPIQNFWDDIHPITRTELNKRNYPTQKPIKLLDRIIESSCPKGGKVLDPFGGSGTTLISSLENQIPSYVKIIDINEDAINLMNKLSNQGLLKFS